MERCAELTSQCLDKLLSGAGWRTSQPEVNRLFLQDQLKKERMMNLAELPRSLMTRRTTRHTRRLQVERLEDRRLLVCTVTSTADPAEVGETTLRDCVESGDPEIQFDLPEGDQVIAMDDPIVVEDPIIIRGMLNRPTELDLRTRITISGTNALGDSTRIFEIRPEGDLTLNHLTLTGGNGEGTTMFGAGGAILNDGRLTINNSTLHSNSADVGGAIFSSTESVSIFQSTLSGNTAFSSGGALAIGPTFDPIGFSIDRSTIVYNSSYGSGGGLALGAGVVAEIRNTIVSGNLAKFAPDVINSASADVGYSIFGSAEGFEYFSQYGPVPFTFPELAPLRDNGGETDTHLPMLGSPAVDAASGLITSGTDQRGAPRAVCISTGGCAGGGADIGAVERGTAFPEPDCDFNDDGACDCGDINALVADVLAGNDTPLYDMNVDGLVDTLDVEIWLRAAGQSTIGRSYLPGDANLDGFVNAVDFRIWNANRFSAVNGWCKADFNVDGIVGGADLLVWNQYKFQLGPTFSRSVAAAPMHRTTGTEPPWPDKATPRREVGVSLPNWQPADDDDDAVTHQRSGLFKQMAWNELLAMPGLSCRDAFT